MGSESSERGGQEEEDRRRRRWRRGAGRRRIVYIYKRGNEVRLGKEGISESQTRGMMNVDVVKK